MIFVDKQITIPDEVLSALGPFRFFSGRTLSNSDLRLHGATALFVRSTVAVDAQLLNNTKIGFVGSATAGIDHVDTNYLHSRNITFAHAPASNAWAVAEYVYAWIRILQPERHCQVCIIGHGNIGSRLQAALATCGYNVVVYDPPKYGHTKQDLNTLITSSQVVTLHVPYTNNGLHPTRHLISAKELNVLPHDALVINTSRGGVVADRELAIRCAEGRLRAVLDVFDGEPVISSEVLRHIPYISPHIAGYSKQAKESGGRMIVDAFIRWRGGAEPVVNKTMSINRPSTEALLQSESDLRPVYLESLWFRKEYSKQPTPAQFDALRTSYQPRSEVLSALFSG